MLRHTHKSSRSGVKVESVVFDFDDTILLGINNAWKLAAKETFGEKFIDDFFAEVEKRREQGGIGLVDYINLVGEKDPQTLASLLDKFKMFEKNFEQKRAQLNLATGFIDFVEKLKKDKVKIILLSARTKKTVFQDLTNFDLLKYFDNVYCKEDTIVDNKRVYKDDPRCLNFVLKNENLNRVKTWVIGDDIEKDVQSAATNSCMAIIIGSQNKNTFMTADNEGTLLHFANDFNDVMKLYQQQNKSIVPTKKLISNEQAKAMNEAIKQGKKLVVTVGVFDLFHLGHAALLAQIKHKAAKQFGVDFKDVYLIVGVQDQGRAVNDKSAIFESEADRIKAVQTSGFCDLAISRGGFPTDLFVDSLNREINAVNQLSTGKSIDLWFTGADQTADTIKRAGLIVDSLNRIDESDKGTSSPSFFVKMSDRSTHGLSSTRLRGLIKANQDEIPWQEKLQLARKEVENATELTDDAKQCIFDLYHAGVLNEESLSKFNINIADIHPRHSI